MSSWTRKNISTVNAGQSCCFENAENVSTWNTESLGVMLPSSAVIPYQGGVELSAMCRPTAPSSRLEIIIRGTVRHTAPCIMERRHGIPQSTRRKRRKTVVGSVLLYCCRRRGGPFCHQPDIRNTSRSCLQT
ncbi:hypothetical protein LZ31DRAFT_314373 [Colletotrichum somersetense]|nr:hypothetical protein LZ31DRAFT_314373 [Colletotrichum somersetense]